MSIIDQMYSNFCRCARTIPGFKIGQKEDVNYDITDLANAYIKAYDENDQEGMNRYISALMVRYWHMVPYLWDKSKSSKLSMEDMVMWIYEGFAKAFKYRSWLDPNKEVSKDPKGAEKCFNQCITSVRQYWYRHFNTNQSKVNYIASSLDSMYETLGDSFDDGLPQEDMYDSANNCRDIILMLVKENKIFEAILMDRICFEDTCKEHKHTKQIKIVSEEGESFEDATSYSYSLDNKKIISSLKSIDNNYILDFSKTYGVNPQEVTLTLNKYTKKNISNNIQEALIRVRNDKKVMSVLC